MDYLPDFYVEPPLARPLWLIVAIFITSYALFQWAWTQTRDTAIERAVIHHATAAPAAWAIQRLSPEKEAFGEGSRIRAKNGGINILNGCEGTEILFLLFAAFLAAPLKWKSRIAGVLLSVPLVWLLNQGRVLALFYAYQLDRELFAMLHGTVAPLVLITIVSLAFMSFVHASRVRS